MIKVIINADDFGISKSVNAAVIEMYHKGNLSSASIMAAGKEVSEAIELALQNSGLKVGLHFNITTGKSAAINKLSLLANKNNIFKYGFIMLLFLSILKRKQFRAEVKLELESQISLLKSFGIKLSHIDGHRHIHYLPGVFNIVKEMAITENIPRIRIINESLMHTLALKKLPPISGIIKWLVLKFLSLLNGAYGIKTPIYFFSIIYSGRINNLLFKNFNLKKEYSTIEIMLHPSLSPNQGDLEYEKIHLLSKYRKIEFQFIKPEL